jgi:hypothetical protein
VKTILSMVAALTLLAMPSRAQVCAPVVPSGQPVLAAFPPACTGTILPPAVWLGGNAGFGMTLPPVVPAGYITLLVLNAGMPMSVPLPPGLLSPLFGPGIFMLGPAPVMFSPGLSTGAPMLVPLPLPASGGPMAPWFTVQVFYYSPALGIAVLTPATAVSV